MNTLSIRAYIEQYYPHYYQWNRYPVAECLTFNKVAGEWGVFSNFYSTPICVDDVVFKNVEQLYQMMKFRDINALHTIHQASGQNIKLQSKHFQRAGLCRDDWGMMIIDSLKFCLQMKYDQCEQFRNMLQKSVGFYIVEDESCRKLDTWGAALNGDFYEGSNLMGRLLMELRDNGRLTYTLPPDALDFITAIRPL